MTKTELINNIDFMLDCIIADRYEVTLLEAYKNTQSDIIKLREYIKKELNGT